MGNDLFHVKPLQDGGYAVMDRIGEPAELIAGDRETASTEENGAKTFTYPEGTAVGYFTKSEYQKPGIYKDPEGYTPNAWVGSNCPKDRFLPVKEVAGYIREYIKSDPELRACKWSVTTESTPGCQSLTVALMAGPFDVFSEEWKEKHPYDVKNGYTQHGDYEKAVTPEAFRVISKVKAFAMSYNHDDSNGMIDYYDRGFYDHYEVGKWNKPYTKTKSAARKYINVYKAENLPCFYNYCKASGLISPKDIEYHNFEWFNALDYLDCGPGTFKINGKEGYFSDCLDIDGQPVVFYHYTWDDDSTARDMLRDFFERPQRFDNSAALQNRDAWEKMMSGVMFRRNDHCAYYRYGSRQAENRPEPAAPAAGSLRIVDYSEKAVAVVGDTKPVKDILRKLGGRFNSRLTCGAGWVFSKKKADEVRAALTL